MTRTLLALLATAAPAPVDLDAIVEALWPGDAPASAPAAARNIVWRARQHLPAEVIVTDNYGGYRLDLALCWLDHLEYTALVERARHELIQADGPAALATLDMANALWRGTPLVAWSDATWADAAIVRLTELHSGAVEDHAAARAATGDLTGAIVELETACAAGPTREHAWSLLIDCLTRAGRRREAARASDTARAHLASIGLEPGIELRHSADRLQAAAVNLGSPQSQLVGRVSAVQSLVGCIARGIASRRSAFILVEGEAGIGKSSLVEAATGQLASIIKVANGFARCDRLVALPYAPLSRVAAALAPEPRPVLQQLRGATTAMPEDDAQLLGQWQLHEALADVFTEAAGRPGIAGLTLVVEDIQWAPANTLAALRHLVLHRSDQPIIVVATRRSAEPMDPTAAEIVADLEQSGRTTVLTVPGLTEASSAELFTSLGGRPERAGRAYAMTGGNPFYLRSLAATEDVEGTEVIGLGRTPALAAALDARIRVLPPDVRSLLELASVGGEEFDESLLRAVVSTTTIEQAGYAGQALRLSPAAVTDAIGTAVVAGLLTAGPRSGHWQFVHDLIRQALYHSVGGPARARLHLLFGRVMEQQQLHRPTPIDRLAHHFAHAWPACTAADAAIHLRRAGDLAIRQLDLELALRFYNRALDLFTQEGLVPFDESRSELAIAAGQVRIELGQAEAARESLYSVAEQARRHGSGDVCVEATAALVNAWQGRPLPEPTLELLRAAVTIPVDRAKTAQRLLIGVLASIDPDEVASSVHDALYGRRGDPVADQAELLTVLWRWQRPPLRLVRAREQIQLGQRAGLREVEAGGVIREWISLVEAGQGDLLERTLPAACHRGGGQLTTAQAIAMLWTTAAATGRGDFAAAAVSLAKSQDAVHEIAAAIRLRTPGVALLLDAQSLSLTAFAQPVTRSVRYEAMRTSWAPDAKGLECFSALFAGLGGDTERAWLLCTDLVEQLRAGGRAAADWLGETAITAAACGLAGHLDGVAVCREALAPYIEHNAIIGATLFLGPVASRLAVAMRATGDTDATVELLELGVTVAERAHARPYVVQGRLQLAAALRARGDAGGATPLEALAHVEARELGLRTP